MNQSSLLLWHHNLRSERAFKQDLFESTKKQPFNLHFRKISLSRSEQGLRLRELQPLLFSQWQMELADANLTLSVVCALPPCFYLAKEQYLLLKRNNSELLASMFSSQSKRMSLPHLILRHSPTVSISSK